MKVILKIDEAEEKGFIITGSSEKLKEIELNSSNTFIFGKLPENTFAHITGDNYISRLHFFLDVSLRDCFLKDLGSKNGTTVNKRKLSRGEKVKLSDRDRIRAGKTDLLINIVYEEAERYDKEETLLLPTKVRCTECKRDVSDEISSENSWECKTGFLYICRECIKKKEEEVYRDNILCEICRKDMTLMANNDGKREDFRDCATYICPDCKPLKDENLPDNIGEYELLNLLGKGVSGEVFKAWHIPTGRLVALKKIHSIYSMNDRMSKLFLREISVLSELSNSNIIRLYNMGLSGKEHYFVSEFINGGDVCDYMLKNHMGPLPYREACHIICQSLDGLEYAHSRKIIHRDIKPKNILVRLENNGLVAKLGDFGHAKNFEEAGRSFLTREGDYGGTIMFMSPEHFTNYRHLKPPGDTYSMGISLYYLLTGKYPYKFPSPLDIMAAEKKGIKIDLTEYEDPVLLLLDPDYKPAGIREHKSDIPDKLAGVVDKSVQKKIRERYLSAKEFKEDLIKALIDM